MEFCSLISPLARVWSAASAPLAALLLLLVSLTTTATPANASTAPCGVYNLIGGNLAPNSLHDTRVYLCYSDVATSPNGLPFRAWAKAYMRSGDILSIDRSIGDINSTEWPTTSTVQSEGGGWTYKETTSRGGWTTAGYMEAFYNAVRICVRHNGALQCQNVWFADHDL